MELTLIGGGPSLFLCHLTAQLLQFTSTTKIKSHADLWVHVYALGRFIFDGEASYVRVGGALPRWRPPPHSRLPQAGVLFKSLLRVHEIMGFRHSLALTHCRFDLGCRFISFLYKRMALPPSFIMESLA